MLRQPHIQSQFRPVLPRHTPVFWSVETEGTAVAQSGAGTKSCSGFQKLIPRQDSLFGHRPTNFGRMLDVQLCCSTLFYPKYIYHPSSNCCEDVRHTTDNKGVANISLTHAKFLLKERPTKVEDTCTAEGNKVVKHGHQKRWWLEDRKMIRWWGVSNVKAKILQVIGNHMRKILCQITAYAYWSSKDMELFCPSITSQYWQYFYLSVCYSHDIHSLYSITFAMTL